MSLATKNSFSPRPTTIGGPRRAATILLRIARGERHQRVGAAHHFYGFQDGFFERRVLWKIFRSGAR